MLQLPFLRDNYNYHNYRITTLILYTSTSLTHFHLYIAVKVTKDAVTTVARFVVYVFSSPGRIDLHPLGRLLLFCFCK